MVEDEKINKPNINPKQVISVVLICSIILIGIKFYFFDFNEGETLVLENMSNRTNDSIIIELEEQEVVINSSQNLTSNISEVINITNISNITNITNITNNS